MPQNAQTKAAGSRPAAKKKTVTTSDVVRILREKIRHGHVVPGQRLVEADIVRETSASRSKVREALKRMETEGLVTIEEFRGASVRQLSMEEVSQIYMARMALEGLLAAEFAAADKPRMKKKLQALQDEMDALENTGNHRRFAKLNDEWHAQIIKGSGNQYAAQFLTQLSVPVYRLLFASFYSAQRIDHANADHKVITRAIVAGDVAGAEKAMRAHIKDGLDSLLEMSEKLHI
jgi:DNA-binding GntR family transcriptional regulator